MELDDKYIYGIIYLRKEEEKLKEKLFIK